MTTMTTMSETQTVSEQTEHTQGGMELLMQTAPTIGERIAALEADRDRLAAELREITTILATAYYRLIFLGQFEGRHTMQVQCELAAMRDAIAKQTNQEPQDVQDNAEAGRAYSILAKSAASGEGK